MPRDGRHVTKCLTPRDKSAGGGGRGGGDGGFDDHGRNREVGGGRRPVVVTDYEGLRNLFKGLASRVGIEYDGVYDWTTAPKSIGPIGGHGRRTVSEGSGSGGRRYCEACNARRR